MILNLKVGAGSGGADSSALGLAAAMDEDRDAYSAQRAQDVAERQKWRSEQRDTLDELLPKATAGRCGLLPIFTSALACS